MTGLPGPAKTACMNHPATRTAPELLPDFCSGPVLLSVALITQLVAVLIMFVTQPVGAFFWERFALLSLYLQWNGLCGAAVLCQARSWLSRMPTWFVLFASYILLLGVTATEAGVVRRWIGAAVWWARARRGRAGGPARRGHDQRLEREISEALTDEALAWAVGSWSKRLR